jgi:asparagine synthase (glutamine-hydrolysing)
MQEASGRPVKTYTVGFDGAVSSDERASAHAVACELGSDHHEVEISAAELPHVFEDFLDSLDQPSGDALNTRLAATAAAPDVKVVLTGVGADELFYGYRFWRSAVKLGVAGKTVRRAPVRWRVALASAAGGVNDLALLGRARKAVAIAAAPESGRVGLTPPERRALGLPEDDTEGWVAEAAVRSDPGRHADLHCYLSPVLLADLDAMTMALSLEARAPFLDHRLVEWALRLPPAVHWDHSGGKALLRSVARDLVPTAASGPKRGFELPLARWMGGPLSPLVDDLTEGIISRGLVRGPVFRDLVARVRAGRRHPRSVWHLLVLEAWLQRHLPDVRGVSGATPLGTQ